LISALFLTDRGRAATKGRKRFSRKERKVRKANNQGKRIGSRKGAKGARCHFDPFAKYLQNSDPAVNGYLYDDITSRIEKDLRPTREAIRYMLDLIAQDLPQAQRVSDKEYWDLSLLDEIQKSGFVDYLQKN